jgi:hypothetical protein
MTAKAAELAFVRRAVASSILGRARALVFVRPSCLRSSGSNAANNPAEPKFTLQYWNYYAPSLNSLNNDAENGEARVLIPFKIAGIQQIVHIDPPIVTNPTATGGPRTGLGDTQIYNFTLGKFDLGMPQKVTFGLGPLVAIPTSTSTNFGINKLQAGAAGIILAPQKLGSPGCAGDLSANALGSQLSCDGRAAANLLQSASRILPALVGRHDL